MKNHPIKSLGVLVAASLALSACAEGPDAITTPLSGGPSFHLIPVATPQAEYLVLCKVGPAGTYTFQVDATHPVLLNEGTGLMNLSSAAYSITVGAASTIDVGGNVVGGACFEYTNGTGNNNHIGLAPGSTDVSVTVVETNIPAGIQFAKVDTYQRTGANVVWASSVNNTATVHIGGNGTGPSGLLGANVVIYNEGTPQTGAGCTPGFWKQEQHFQYWDGYATTDLIKNVFSNTNYTTSKGVNVGNATLLAGLSFGGGPTTGDAAAILLRAGIAALLNAADSDVDYYKTEAEVIAAVNAALLSGDRNTMLTLAAELDFENNRGCTAAD